MQGDPEVTVSQPHTLLPDSAATRFVAVAPAFVCDACLGVLDPGELVLTDTSGGSSRNERRGRATTERDLLGTISAPVVELDATSTTTAA